MVAGVAGPTRLFIGGEFVDAADGATIDVTSPHDGSLLAEVAEARGLPSCGLVTAMVAPSAASTNSPPMNSPVGPVTPAMAWG